MPILPHVAVARKPITVKPQKGKPVKIPKGGVMKILSETANTATAQVTTPKGVIATGTVSPADYSGHVPPYSAITNKATSIWPPKGDMVDLDKGTSLEILIDNGDYAWAQVVSSGVKGNIPPADFDPV
jgi:hypothetical protein